MTYRLSIIEVSEELGVSPRSVFEMIERGDLAGEQVGRTVMVRREVFERFIARAPRRGDGALETSA